jgi:hypothetical protein
MPEFSILIVVALLAFLLWYAVVVLLLRPFGVRLPFRRLRSRNGTSRSLTFSQHIWLNGVLYWGCGMWIVMTLGDYLDWKYWNGSAHDLSAGRLLFHAVLWPLGGFAYGWMSWNTRNGNAEN